MSEGKEGRPGSSVRAVDSLISELLRAITFLGFVIVYYNIVFAMDAFDLVDRMQVVVPFASVDIGGWLRNPIYVALVTPLALAVFVVILFARNFLVELARILEAVSLSGLWGIIVFLGVVVGTFTFVGVLSLFVAFQSDDYLTRFAPDLRSQLADLLGVTAPKPPGAGACPPGTLAPLCIPLQIP